ncbi:disease resistance protein Roq1-like [Cryptomeria japonica]|uniref:disease resistance protein Roq1-like n=1 Tax=Cryptomeria japonica TaxID=3369 RepID=UPI0027DA0EFB|nr:disease resistance protein Roq1-like [Cryptomeria japonica]
MASLYSSSSCPRNEKHDAFSGIDPCAKRRNVDESSRLFDVFINHRGPDVKQTVALQLYKCLTGLGIHTFLDSEEKELGDSFPSTIKCAIHSASAHIAIFSNGYAESPWCLAELLLMLETTAKIFPVFYGVKPSDLRYIESGEYGKAFKKYEEKKRYMEKLKEWKEALQSVSFLTGYEISSNFNSDCQNIVSAVQNEIRRKISLRVAKYPVGLHKLVKDFERACYEKIVENFERQCWTNEGRKQKAQIVGIFGMGGVGKTTLAKELFNRKHSQYRRACFLSDVREAYANNNFPSLQFRLVKDLFQRDTPKFHSTEEGMNHIGDCIRRSDQLSFLIVLDDIDHLQQMDVLLIMEMLKKSVDSLVIVTTRDVGVLINTGITAAYYLKEMDRYHARELFCWHAFGQPHPTKDYENLVNSFVNVCRGLPLCIQVLGSHVRGRDWNYWSLELSKVSKTLPRDIHQRLKISFDALDYEEQQIFMDIACFFVDESKSIAVEVWEASGWSAQHALETLRNKCLIQEIKRRAEIGEDRCALRMHDHLRDLGRQMADRSSLRRLWRPQDLKYLESKGFLNILAQTKGRCFHSFIDKSINCGITYFLGESDVRGDKSTFLLWLKLQYEGFQNQHQHNLDLNKLRPCIPSWIPLQRLRCLIIRNLRIKTLWRSYVQAPTQLQELQIFHISLKEFSDLLEISNSLEKLTIGHCNHLKTMSGLSDFKKLTELNMSNCLDLQELSVVHLSCLEKIVLHNCYSLKTLSGMSYLRKLVELDISGCPVLEQLHLVGLDSLTCIMVDDSFQPEIFHLHDCRKLLTIGGFLNPKKLVSIDIRDCPNLVMLLSLQGLSNLETTIIIDGCMKLNDLILATCQNLKRVSGKFDLKTIIICDCPELEALTFLEGVTCLETIGVYGCGKLNSLQLLECQNLKQLSISDCPELEELPCCASQTSLEKISIVRCENLQSITLPPKLVELRIEECRELKKMAVICDHSEWLELQELSSVVRPSYLKRLTIHSCDNLQTIQGIDELHALKKIQLLYCSNAALRNWVPMFKSVLPELLVMTGRAVDGAHSILKPHLFSDADVVFPVISEISTHTSVPGPNITPELNAVIFCCVVEIDSGSPVQMINEFLPEPDFDSPWPNFKVPAEQGEYMITIVTTSQDDMRSCNDFVDDFLSWGITKAAYRVEVKKGKEWKTELHTIIDRLHRK